MEFYLKEEALNDKEPPKRLLSSKEKDLDTRIQNQTKTILQLRNELARLKKN
jgi:hypothetical protein